MQRLMLVGLVLLSACVETATTSCTDDRTCPGGTVCDLVHQGCVLPEQLQSCIGAANNTDCVVAGEAIGICHSEVCIVPRCGDGLVLGTEQCDGINLDEKVVCGDIGYYNGGALACNPDCTFNKNNCGSICGDGVVDTAMGEDCDGDALGAKTTCTELNFYDPGLLDCTTLCRYDVDACTGSCGDGDVRFPIEACEDTLGWTDQRSCLDFGFDAGRVECARCGPAFEGCQQINGQFGRLVLYWITAMHGRASNDVYGVVYGDVVHFDGSTWTGTNVGGTLGVAQLQDVWVTATGQVWVAGESGIGFWNGVSWAAVTDNSTATYTSVWASNTASGDAWAVGVSGAIVHVTGTTGAPVTPASGQTLNDVWGSGPTDVWAVGAGGTIAHYTGGQWQTVSSGVTAALNSIYGVAANDIWAVGDADGSNVSVLLHYNGTGWTRVPGPKHLSGAIKLTDVWATGPRDIWLRYATAGFVDVGVYHFDGNVFMPVSTDLPVLTGWSATPSDGWLAEFPNTALQQTHLYRTSGTLQGSWVQDVEYDIKALWVTGDRTFAATGTASSIQFGIGLFENKLGVWQASNVSGTQNALWGSADNDVWSVGFNGQISHFTGSTWSSQTIAGSPSLRTVWGSAANDVWVAGDDAGGTPVAVILHNTGAGWVPYAASTFPRVQTIHGSGAQSIWATTSTNKLLRFDGTWTVGYTTPGWIGNDVYVAGPNAVWVTDTDSALHLFNGSTWSDVPLGGNLVTNIDGTGANDVFAIGPTSLLHWDGVRWSPVRTETLEHSGALFVSPRHVRYTQARETDQDGVELIERTVAWACAASETGAACTDRVDNDCDGKIDGDDVGCP